MSEGGWRVGAVWGKPVLAEGWGLSHAEGEETLSGDPQPHLSLAQAFWYFLTFFDHGCGLDLLALRLSYGTRAGFPACSHQPHGIWVSFQLCCIKGVTSWL